MTTETREIDKKIANGCKHHWDAIWWKLGHWRARAVEILDPRTGKVIVDDGSSKYIPAGYRKGYRCSQECGLAYLKNSGAVVVAERVE